MITDIFGNELTEHELVEALLEGCESDGERIEYSDCRGTMSTLLIRPSQPRTIIQHDELFGSRLYPIRKVEEAVETFMGYVEIHEKSAIPVVSEVTHEVEYAY